MRETQEWLASLIAPPERLPATAADSSLRARLSLPLGIQAAIRVGVYAGGYPARLLDAVAESHPAVAHVLGQGAFAALVARYVRALPPQSYNLNDAGSRLAEYLPVDRLSAQLPFLSDLARMEWAIVRAFHAPVREAFDPATVTNWSAEDWFGTRIDLQVGTALVRSAWPIHAVWAARETPVDEIDIDMTAGGNVILIHRAGFEVVCESIGEAEATAIQALLGGATLGDVSERLSAADAGTVAASFARWVHAGLVVSCRRDRAALHRPDPAPTLQALMR